MTIVIPRHYVLPDSNCQGHIGQRSHQTGRRLQEQQEQPGRRETINTSGPLSGRIHSQHREKRGQWQWILAFLWKSVDIYNICFILDMANFRCISTSCRYRTMTLYDPDPDCKLSVSVLTSHDNRVLQDGD